MSSQDPEAKSFSNAFENVKRYDLCGEAAAALPVCERKAWLILRNIQSDPWEPKLVQGRLEHQRRAEKRRHKETVIAPGAKTDHIKDGWIVEQKRGKLGTQEGMIQSSFYAAITLARGYPLRGIRVTDKDGKQLLERSASEAERIGLDAIARLIALKREACPTLTTRESLCVHCAYRSLCFS